MTPKEKAKELVNKYYLIISGTEVSFLSKLIKLPNKETDYELAKQCALIAVDEILKNNIILFEDYLNDEYWKEVKQEIELL